YRYKGLNISSSELQSVVIYPYPSANASHETLQSYMGTIQGYNNKPGTGCRSLRNTKSIETNRPDSAVLVRFPYDGACLTLLHKMPQASSAVPTHVFTSL